MILFTTQQQIRERRDGRRAQEREHSLFYKLQDTQINILITECSSSLTSCIQYSQTEKTFYTNVLEMNVFINYSKIAWWHMRNTYNCLITIPYFPGWLFKVSVSAVLSASSILPAKMENISLSLSPQSKVEFIWLNEELFACPTKLLVKLMEKTRNF